MQQAMGFHVQYPAYCDGQDACHRFVKANHAGHFQHAYYTLEDVCSGEEIFCSICSDRHTITMDPPDVLCISPSCQPFSAMRSRTESHGKCAENSESHPEYDVSMDWALQVIKLRNPGITLVEEVKTWMFERKGQPSPLSEFIAKLKEISPGCGIAVQSVCQGPWMEGSRPRQLFYCKENVNFMFVFF